MVVHYIQFITRVRVPLKRKRVVIHYIQSVTRVDIKKLLSKDTSENMSSSQGTVNSMHLLLLHQVPLVKNDGTMYKPMNQVLHKEEIHPRRLVFSDRQCRVNEDSQFVTFVLFKLFQTGCKFFVQNMALRLYSGKKLGIHCDLVGYHRKTTRSLSYLTHGQKTEYVAPGCI